MRLSILLGCLALMFGLAALTLQTPSPRPVDAPAEAFSAHRAMVDIREISKAPHPLGTAEHIRVREYLAGRLADLGFEVSEQTGDLTIKAVQRLKREGGDAASVGYKATNLIGIRQGARPDLPPLMLMAHYDTTVHSPGAGDDSTGVAVILETVRALGARQAKDRTLIVLLTDGEEIGLEGARIFFAEHELAKASGFIINLEARGGGGRVHMFETGKGDGPTIGAFSPLALAADGGVTSTSIGSYLYDRMPNGTDFTIPREMGIQGINLAFLDRAYQYHSPESVPEKLDIGSVQHMGSQTLEMATRLMGADALPASGPSQVYADVFGRILLVHPPVVGWVLLALSLVGLAFAIYRARNVTALRPMQVVQGMLDGVWFIAASLILSHGVRMLAGPLSFRGETYYTLLHRLPWMEAATALVVLALTFVLLSGGRAAHRRVLGYGFALVTLVVAIIGKAGPVYIGAGAVAAVLSLWPGAASRSLWGGWIGTLALAFILGCALQRYAPPVALIIVWPLLLASVAMAISAWLSPSLSELRGLIAPAIATIIGGAWLMGYGHFVFSALGISVPGALGFIGFLTLMFLRPLVPARGDHWLTVIGATCLLAAVGLSAGSQLAEPATKTVIHATK
ncbi:M28 family peptidase [uncultured Brevundimonas sp.]|uniref:M28 family peptidase n=1 Tax=uncultured Brevundimonas sp. TaxID=213418 RepID=UPI002611399C|nr:M28 family peptidase [uncultured Brevundimonas sp.]